MLIESINHFLKKKRVIYEYSSISFSISSSNETILMNTEEINIDLNK